MTTHGAGVGRVAGLLCSFCVVLAGCGASARHARDTERPSPRPLGSGVQGFDTDEECKAPAYVAVCGRAAAIDLVIASRADNHQVERRRIEVDATAVRVVGHYRSGDQTPEQLMGNYEYDLQLERWAVTRSGRRLVATGSGDYAGWTLTLTFSWTGSAIERHDVDVREVVVGTVAA